MDLLSPMKETIYGTTTPSSSTNSDDSHFVMSEKVQNIAGNIYQQFEKMIGKYDEDVVKELMPLVVSVLEDLDLSYMENQEHEVELELLREDNEQLVTQFEREKQLRKLSEQKVLEIEYGVDDDRRDLQGKVESLESIVRMLELKSRNSSDHASRLEEKESEMKDEYSKLHSRYTELLKTHMDYLERTKVVLSNEKLENNIGSKARSNASLPSLKSSTLESDPIIEDMNLKPLQSSFEFPSLSSFTHSSADVAHSLKSELQSIPETKTSPSHESLLELDNGDTQKPICYKEKRSINTLYQELSFDDNTEGDGDENSESLAADSFFAGMGKEVEQLIHENNELLATKNALNIVKDDLIAKVDELTSELEISKEEIKSLQTVKERQKQKVQELEDEIKKIKEEIENSKANKSDDEEGVPMTQRKRFTRLEMARVLMEKNQYKERFMELQEAVRWADMIRATKNEPMDAKKNRTSIWKFFSSLFSSQERGLADASLHYNAPSGQVSPAIDVARRKRTADKNRNLDFLDSDITSERLQQQRAKERKEQYKQVRAYVKKEDGRMQAYGWSLPTKATDNLPKTSANSDGRENLSIPLSVPVPAYCRPLIEKDPGLKIWCAAGINMTGGRTPDGGSLVGGSVFYSNPPTLEDPTTLSHVEQLDKELEASSKARLEHEQLEQSLTSLVWICTSTYSSSSVNVIDANNPKDVLDSFPVCSSHLLCISSIPGSKDTDFPVDENFLKLGVEAQQTTSTETVNSQDDTVTTIGNLTYVTCSNSRAISLEPVVEQEKPESPLEDRMHQWVVVKSASDFNKDITSSEVSPNSLAGSQQEKMSTVLPTMWLGAQNGKLYIHSSVAQWCRCIESIKLKDAILSIVHVNGRVFVSLANGTVAIFHRTKERCWDFVNYHILDLGAPNHSIRCLTVVHNKVWCGYMNKIHVIDALTLNIEKCVDAHPKKDSQVRLMTWAGEGVWVSIRLDSTLRLYHAHTYQHLQDVDIEPYVSKMLGTGKLGFSFVRITALLISSYRLWIGTGNGVIISVPLCDKSPVPQMDSGDGKLPGSVVRVYSDSQDNVTPGSYIPYCNLSQAQLSYHGHRDAVKFFVAVPGHKLSSQRLGQTSPIDLANSKYMLVLSGGEGYIDFRLGDGEDDDEDPIEKKPSTKGDWSHLISWQVALSQP